MPGMAGGVSDNIFDIFDIFIYLLTAIGLTPCDSNTVHIYTHTHTIHTTTQNEQKIENDN